MSDFAPAVYLMANRRNGALYCGVTSQLVQRIYQHREKVTGGHSATYEINRLVWFEMHATMEAAITREKQIKKWNRAWKTRLIEQENSEWRDLAVDLGFEPLRVQYVITNPRHPREGGGPSDEASNEDGAGDGFPPSRE